MSIQLSIGGTDFSNYVVSTNRTNSICKPIGKLSVLLAPDLPKPISIYEVVEFYENGTKVFTGYTMEALKARLPIESELTCNDVLVRTEDTWLDTNYISYGESVAHWIGFFLQLSGITNVDIGVGSDRFVYEGFGWQYISAWDAIVQTVQVCPYQIMADRNGQVKLVSLIKSTPVATISNYIEYSRTRSDSWLRNRAVVIGATPLAADRFRSNPYLPDEVRTAVVATGAIHNQNTADWLAYELLDCFAVPLDIKTILVEGNPIYEIGQTINFTDTWSGYSGDCIITSIEANYDSEGYRVQLTLDEKCPNFWGWDKIPHILYCGTWGHGVYKSGDSGGSWSTAGLAGKYINALYLVSETSLWAACKDGVYYTENSGDSWTKYTMGDPNEEIEEAELDWVDIVVENMNQDTTYVLAGAYNLAWLYYTNNHGTTWTVVELL